jgi:hypothetical protein
MAEYWNRLEKTYAISCALRSMRIIRQVIKPNVIVHITVTHSIFNLHIIVIPQENLIFFSIVEQRFINLFQKLKKDVRFKTKCESAFTEQ